MWCRPICSCSLIPDPREMAAQDIAASIDKADINHLTPMEALELLAGFKRKMTEAGDSA